MKHLFAITFISVSILSLTFSQNAKPQKTNVLLHTEHKIEYKGWVINTNVALPAIRYNILKNEPSDSRTIGSIEYFNSAGAGVSFNFGKIKITSPSKLEENDELDVKFVNHIGFSFGVLFSQNNNDGITRSIFAPTLGIQVLDFQLGFGTELGTLSKEYRRGFFTLAYSIPISKLTNWGGFIMTNPTESKPSLKKDSNKLKFNGVTF